MSMSESQLRLRAIERFQRSAFRAEWLDRWARLTGKCSTLLKYDEVAARLHLRQQVRLGLQLVPLHQIVGSVGRSREFTRGFWPRDSVHQDRWVALDIMLNSLTGFPPVELYKIGEAYFVLDGNHRISVARANRARDIEADVTELIPAVPVTPQEFLNGRWLVQASHADFLRQTDLARLRPDHSIRCTDPAQYATLLQHIAVHHYLRNHSRANSMQDGQPAHEVASWRYAVASWYDTVYLPLVTAMRVHKVQAHFPKCTEADLYLRITQHREQLAYRHGLAPLSPEGAVRTFVETHSDRPIRGSGRSLRLAWRHVLGRVRSLLLPVGMVEEEYHSLRLGHAAGALSLAEAAQWQPHACPLFLSPHEGESECAMC
jgi:hypothetical protein